MTLPIPHSPTEREHECFARLQNALSEAHDAAKRMGDAHQQDKRDLWHKAAVMFKVLEGQVMDLATQGMFTREDGKFGGGRQ